MTTQESGVAGVQELQNEDGDWKDQVIAFCFSPPHSATPESFTSVLKIQISISLEAAFVLIQETHGFVRFEAI